MSYLSISFTHKNTDIQMREKIAFSNEGAVETFLKTLYEHPSINEVVVLSTCNRVEIMTTVSHLMKSQTFIIESLSKYSGIDFDTLHERADIYDNTGAIHHLFTVSSALDSLVIGETQIVGQLKDAYRLSLSKGYCNQKITRSMNYAFKCAARVRNATSLGTGSVSVASTAVAKAKSITNSEKGIKAIVIGAGEMSQLTIKHLLKANFEVVLLSRDIKKARLLADTYDEFIDVQAYENINKLLNEIPFMFTATSAPYPIITADMIVDCNFSRYWFDIAVPRDIADIKMNDLHIYAVDDLQDIVDDNMSLRAKQAKQAYVIVNKESAEFFDWLKTLEVEPVVKHLYLKSNNVIEKKLKSAIKKGYIRAEDEENIKKLCETVFSEFLHQPTTQLKNISRNMDCDMVLGTVQNIFGLEGDSNTVNNCEHAMKFNN